MKSKIQSHYYSYWIFLIIVLFISILAIGLNLHGFSIGMYHKYFYGNVKDDNKVLFEPRNIRVDEWGTTSTQLHSQILQGFPTLNKAIGIGQNMAMYYDAPTKHWTTLYRPSNWFMFVTPPDRALSVLWWTKTSLLLISLYSLGLLISKKSIFLSIFFTLFLYYSPFVQWWYTNPGFFVEMLSYFCWMIILSYHMMQVRSLKKTVLLMLLFNYVALCFFFVIYPPFQITLIYLFISIAIAFLIAYRKRLTFKKITLIFCIGLIVPVVIGKYLIEFNPEITLLRQSIYPGSRVEAGGSWMPEYFFRGLFSNLLQNEKRSGIVGDWIPNSSEGSGFLMISIVYVPFVIFYYFRKIKKNKIVDPLLLGISIYILFLLIWFVVGFSPPINHWLLLEMIPLKRAIIGFGFAEALFIVRLIVIENDFSVIFPKRLVVSISIIIGVITFLLGSILKSTYPFYIPDHLYVILIAFLATLLIYLFGIRHIWGFITLALLLTIFSTFKVNPLYRGEDSLIHNAVASKLKSLAVKDPDAKWIVFEEYDHFGNFLIGNGIKSLSGVYLYPNPQLWSQFDPEGNYKTIWNRYSHVGFGTSKATSPKFILLDEGRFNVYIDPCSKILHQLNVKYYIFFSPVNYACMNLIEPINTAYTFYIYKSINL